MNSLTKYLVIAKWVLYKQGIFREIGLAHKYYARHPILRWEGSTEKPDPFVSPPPPPPRTSCPLLHSTCRYLLSYYEKKYIFRLWTPAEYVMHPQSESTCHNIVNLYVQIRHVRLGVEIICTAPTTLLGHKRKRSLKSFWVFLKAQ